MLTSIVGVVAAAAGVPASLHHREGHFWDTSHKPDRRTSYRRDWGQSKRDRAVIKNVLEHLEEDF